MLSNARISVKNYIFFLSAETNYSRTHFETIGRVEANVLNISKGGRNSRLFAESASL